MKPTKSKLPPFEIPDFFLALGLMRTVTIAQVGTTYPIAARTGERDRAARQGATYGVTALVVAALAAGLAASPSLLARGLAAFVGASFVGAMIVDPEPWSRKLAVGDVVPQLRALVRFTLEWLGDTAGAFALLFATYLCLAPTFQRLGLWHPWAFVAGYGAWVVARLAWCVWTLATLRRRYDAAAPPFVLAKANFRTRERAARHLVWSLLLGHVGLAVRCGRQLAVLALFGAVAGPLPAALAARFPATWALGLVGLVALFYLYGGVIGPLYYKVHRTLHEAPALWAGIHRVHHVGTVPSWLDSGTESPLELVFAEFIGPVHFLWPSWLFLLAEIPSALGQCTSHHAQWHPSTRSGTSSHVAHHFYRSFNYSCSVPEPAETLYVRRAEAPAGAGVAEG